MTTSFLTSLQRTGVISPSAFSCLRLGTLGLTLGAWLGFVRVNAALLLFGIVMLAKERFCSALRGTPSWLFHLIPIIKSEMPKPLNR